MENTQKETVNGKAGNDSKATIGNKVEAGNDLTKEAINTLHNQFKRYGMNAKEWMRKCVLLLPEIERHKVWRRKKFGSIYEYSAKLAGMNRGMVDDALWILRKIEDKPKLMQVIEKQGINKIRPIVTIVTKETEDFWAEKAKVMSRAALQTYAHEFRKQMNQAEGGVVTKVENASGVVVVGGDEGMCANNRLAIHAQKLGDEPEQINRLEFRTGPKIEPENVTISTGLETESVETVARIGLGIKPVETGSVSPAKVPILMQLSKEVAEKLAKLKGKGDWNELMKQFLELREKQLEENKPQEVATLSRHIPNKIKRYVTAKTNNQCAFPGCNKPCKILHHADRFALQKVHNPDRIMPLCEGHERLAHLGLIENEDGSVGGWRIREEADKKDSRYLIDRRVGEYRMADF